LLAFFPGQISIGTDGQYSIGADTMTLDSKDKATSLLWISIQAVFIVAKLQRSFQIDLSTHPPLVSAALHKRMRMRLALPVTTKPSGIHRS
jgi:hypothetical protein